MKFVPESAISLETHLEELALRNPIEDFEDDMMIFLTALRVCPRPPTLAQLETGELEGLSRSETDSLKQRLGFKC